MIHLFNCVGELCDIPRKICQECGKLCDCRPCQECCESCSSCISNFLNRPLGLYVLLAELLSGLQVYLSGSVLMQQESLDACALSPETYAGDLGIHTWLSIQLGMAVLSMLFAPYIQYQVWRKLSEKQDQDPELPMVQVSKEQVKESFKEVFLYDIVVCIYVLSLPCSFYWSYMGSESLELSSPACDPGHFSVWSAMLGMAFVWIIFGYTLLWYLSLGCMSFLTVSADQRAAQRAAGPWPGATQHFARSGTQQYSRSGTRGAPAPSAPMKGSPLYAAGAPAYADGQNPTYMLPGAQMPGRVTWRERALAPGQIMKLLACLGLDLFGNASYLLPAVGEAVDLAYAPAQALALKVLFQSNPVATLGFLEELLPFTDILPTATIAWCLEVFAPDHAFSRMMGIRPTF